MTSASPGVTDDDHAFGDQASGDQAFGDHAFGDQVLIGADEPDGDGAASELDDQIDAGLLEPDDGFEDAIAQKQRETEEGLSEQQQRMLVFERQWWRHAGSKEQAIREQFNLSATRYYQMLNRLLDNPAALEFDALVVGRLRRLRATRARARGIVPKSI